MARVGAWLILKDAFQHQAQRQTAFANNDLVFTRTNGRPLRPDYVLNHFHKLTEAVGLPRIRVHDLRHLAATLMIASGVPLAVVSKTMRHSTLSITVNIYGHLTRHAAHQAVDAMATTLNAARDETLAAEHRLEHGARTACDHNDPKSTQRASDRGKPAGQRCGA